MPWILAPGEGPETWGEPGHWPLWLGDNMAYGELGSRAPRVKERWVLETTQRFIYNNKQSDEYTTVCPLTTGHFFICSVMSAALKYLVKVFYTAHSSPRPADQNYKTRPAAYRGDWQSWSGP